MSGAVVSPSLGKDGSGAGQSRLASPPFAAARLVSRTHAQPLPEDGKGAGVAADFEALFIAQLLHAAHGAKLADDPLTGDDTFRDLQDRQLAQNLARATPLGVARLIK